MRTNRRDHDGRHGRVNHRGSSSNRVSRTSGWSRNNQSVSLNRGDQLSVQIEVNVGQVWRRSTIDNDLIENEQIGGGLLDYGSVFLGGSAHDDTTESTAKSQGCVTFKDLGDLLFKVFELERSQEPERTEMEGHHRRDGLLEERGCVEKGPVSAEADDEVDFAALAGLTVNLIVKHP